MTSTLREPLLGVAGTFGIAEVSLSQKFDALHQLIYTQGGIRPTNAAIEEVAKLLYLRLWATTAGDDGQGVRALFAGPSATSDTVERTKQAFRAVLQSSELVSLDASDRAHPLWPLDEPFRLSNPLVLRSAMNIADDVVHEQRAVADPLGTAFDAFLSGRYDHSGGLGTYLTPSSVAMAMADIAFGIIDPLDPAWRGSRTLIDPFCGTGRFLVSAFEVVERSRPSDMLLRFLNQGLMGADQSPTAVAKSALNLLLYGATTPHVFTVQDSITSSQLDKLRNSFAVVLTNPPFGGGKYTDQEGIRRLCAFIPSVARATSVDPALAGIARAIDLVQPGGVVGIVLPDGIVDGRHFDELVARADNISVAANVSLPTATFALSGTVAKTSAVFLRKGAPLRRTVLAKVSHVGFVRQAGKAAADPEGNELPQMVEAVHQALAMEDSPEPLVQISHQPAVASIDSSGLSSLDPSRVDPEALRCRTEVLASGGVPLSRYIAARKRRLQPKGAVADCFISVLHVDAHGAVNWPEAERYEPVTPGQVAEPGEIVVSLLNPSKLRAAVAANRYRSVHCSMEFGVFRTELNPYAVLGLLYTPEVQAQLRPLGRGTSSSRRRIAPEDVLGLAVPNLSDDEVTELGEAIRTAIEKIDSGRRSLARSFQTR